MDRGGIGHDCSRPQRRDRRRGGGSPRSRDGARRGGASAAAWRLSSDDRARSIGAGRGCFDRAGRSRCREGTCDAPITHRPRRAAGRRRAAAPEALGSRGRLEYAQDRGRDPQGVPVAFPRPGTGGADCRPGQPTDPLAWPRPGADRDRAGHRPGGARPLWADARRGALHPLSRRAGDAAGRGPDRPAVARRQARRTSGAYSLRRRRSRPSTLGGGVGR